MLRRRSDALLALSVGMLVAAVIGVQLGHSAIAEINPIHFRGAAEPPRAIDPAAMRPAPDPFLQAFDWNAGQAARAFECGDTCDGREVHQAAAAALAELRPARPAPWWRDTTPAAEPGPWAPGETGPRRLSVERYMHYPIEEGAAEPVATVEAGSDAEMGTVTVFRGETGSRPDVGPEK